MACGIRGIIGLIVLCSIVAAVVVVVIVFSGQQENSISEEQDSEEQDSVPQEQDSVAKEQYSVPKKQDSVPKKQDPILVPLRPCFEEPIEKSGIYHFAGNEKVEVGFDYYCEQIDYGGGWIIIQERIDGSLNFNRDWSAYRNGFGNLNGEHWLGLEKVYQLTTKWNWELLVEMKDFHNNYAYARYSSFEIDSEDKEYKLISLGKHSGTVGDSLRNHVGMMFSTKDRDNDACAVANEGGWWFRSCASAFLNGPFRNVTGKDINKSFWSDFGDDFRGLSYTRMMIRLVQIE